jgi:hypothetical protein
MSRLRLGAGGAGSVARRGPGAYSRLEFVLEAEGSATPDTAEAIFESEGTGSSLFPLLFSGASAAILSAEARLGVDARFAFTLEAEASDVVTPTYANGYTYRRRLALAPQTDLPAETLTDFPVFIKASQLQFLRTVASGGKVQHASGYDVRFEIGGDGPDGTGGTKLDHWFPAYVAATVGVGVFVRIPSWPSAQRLSLWCYYGKAGLVATEENAAGTWRGALAVRTWPTGADLTGRGRSLTPSGVGATTTLLALPASSFGSSSFARRTAPTELTGLSAFTNLLLFQPAGVLTSGSLHRVGDIAGPGKYQLGPDYRVSATRQNGPNGLLSQESAGVVLTAGATTSATSDTSLLWFKVPPGPSWTFKVYYAWLDGFTTTTGSGCFTRFIFGYVGKGAGGIERDPNAWSAADYGDLSDAKMSTNALQGMRASFNTINSVSPGNSHELRLRKYNGDGTIEAAYTPTTSASFDFTGRVGTEFLITFSLSGNTFTATKAAAGIATEVVSFTETDIGDLALAEAVGGEIVTKVPTANRSQYLNIYPTPINTRSATSATLASVLSSAVAGDRIECSSSAGAYSGTYTSTVDGTAARPIVIVALSGATLTGDINLNGDWTAVDGFTVTGATSKIQINGDHCRVTRNAFSGQDYAETQTVIGIAANWAHVDRNSDDLNERNFITGNPPECKNPWVRRNKCTRGGAASAPSEAHNEKFRFGQGQADHPLIMAAIVEYNYFSDFKPNQDPEIISCKSSGNIFHGNTLTSTGLSGYTDPPRFQQRGGENNLWSANWMDATNASLRICGRGHVVAYNRVAGDGLMISAGTVEVPAGGTIEAGNMARAIDVTLAGNVVSQLWLGEDTFSGSNLGPLRTKISANQPNRKISGSTVIDGLSDCTIEVAPVNTDFLATTSATVETPVKLSPVTDVGPSYPEDGPSVGGGGDYWLGLSVENGRRARFRAVELT